MVLTFTVILLGLLLLIPPLKKNSFYMVHAGLVILAAYYVVLYRFRNRIAKEIQFSISKIEQDNGIEE